MNLADKNDLYECWIFCKVLYTIPEIFLKFTEASGSRGAAIFRSNDSFVKIIYKQPMIPIGKIKENSSKMFQILQ